MNVPYLQYIYTKTSPKRVGLAHPSIVPYGCFVTLDSVNILFSIQNEREWVSFEENILKLPESSKNKFNSPSKRLKYKNILNDIISKSFRLLTAKKITYFLKK